MTEETAIKFNPADHLIKVNGNQPYLTPRHAITWFYLDHPLPEGRITTTLISSDPVIMRAEVWVGETMVSTGHANAEGNSNTLKKIESSAIRRALANAGYGTDQVIARIAKDIPLEDAKQMLGSGKNRRIGKDKPLPPLDPNAWENGNIDKWVEKWLAQDMTREQLMSALHVTNRGEWKGDIAGADEAVSQWRITQKAFAGAKTNAAQTVGK